MQANHNTRKRSAQADVVKIRVNGRVVGGYRQSDKIFQKTIHANHFLKKPVLSIALDVQSLRDVERMGATQVEITDDTGAIYRAPIAHIWRRGFERDRGFGRQVALPLDHWANDIESLAEQLSLFAGAA